MAAAGIVLVALAPGVLARGADPDSVASPKPDPAIVCVLESVRIEVEGDADAATEHRETRYAVLREDETVQGIDRITILQSFESHPVGAEVRVHDARKARFSRRLSDFQKMPYLAGDLFISDATLLYVDLPELRPGDTLTVREETRIRPFLGFGVHLFGSLTEPTVLSTYEVRIPEALAPRYEALNGAGEPVVRRAGKDLIWTWSLGPIELAEGEPWSPPPQDLLPGVSIGIDRIAWGPAGSWESLAESYWGEVRDRQKPVPGESLPRFAGRAADDVSEEALGRVQSGVRYVAIALGPGGKIPRPSDETLRTRYGDCKDMSTLLLSMLEGQGSQASLALVRTRPPAGLTVDPLPTLQAFNHAVVCAWEGDRVLWLDPTDRFGTARSPRRDIQGAPALVLTGPHRGATRIPMNGPETNRTIRSLHLRQNAEGTWEAGGFMELRGVRAQQLAARLEAGGKPIDLARAWLEACKLRIPAPPANMETALQGSRPDSLILRFRTPITEPLEILPTGWRLTPPWPEEPDFLRLFRDREREHPVHWPWLEGIVDSLIIEAAWAHFEPLPDTTWSDEIGGVAATIRQFSIPGGVVLVRALEFRDPVFAVVDWERGRDLRRRLMRWSTTGIHLTER